MTRPLKPTSSRLVAVLELGSSSVRCCLAEITPKGPRILEDLVADCRVGEDNFRHGRVGVEAMEEAVESCQGFHQVISGYGTVQVRAVVSAAVRSAQNCDILLERIRNATGLSFLPIDGQEEARLMLVSLRDHLEKGPRRGRTLAVDLSAGGSEFVLLEGGTPVRASSFMLGTLQLRVLVEKTRPHNRRIETLFEFLEASFRRALGSLCPEGVDRVLLMGRDAVALAHLLDVDFDLHGMARIDLDKLTKLTKRLLESGEQHLPLDQIPTLVSYASAFHSVLVQCAGRKTALVSSSTIRDGLLAETSKPGDPWASGLLGRSILGGARDLVERFGEKPEHGEHVATLAVDLFDRLQDMHGLGSRDRVLLEAAGLLHEVGHSINPRSHHKHSAYLIESADMPGLSRRDQLVLGQIARYHRRSPPRPSHSAFMALDQVDRVRVRKLAALLRIADALDAAHKQSLHIVEHHREGARLLLTCSGKPRLSLEDLTLSAKSDLFLETYGVQVQIHATP